MLSAKLKTYLNAAWFVRNFKAIFFELGTEERHGADDGHALFLPFILSSFGAIQWQSRIFIWSYYVVEFFRQKYASN